jgi:hypothetical protein
MNEECMMTDQPVTGWVTQIGKWNFGLPGRVTYLGPQPQTDRPFGICVSSSKFIEGTARVTATIPTLQASSEGPSACLVLGYVSRHAQNYAIGIGGHGLKYTLVRYDPSGSWTPLEGAGSASDLKIAHPYRLAVRIEGLKISLSDDGNLVFDHVLPTSFSQDSRLGLLAWGDSQIEFSDLSIESSISPADAIISVALESFDREGVYKVWTKAIDRRSSDPDGAITSARTLLESVCKHILEKNGTTYAQTADLPALYHAAAEVLVLAPNQQTEMTLKRMLGSCQQVVNTLGELRNKVGDAHGMGTQPAKPALRHASLAVNLAGAMAMFLVETATRQREGSE